MNFLHSLQQELRVCREDGISQLRKVHELFTDEIDHSFHELQRNVEQWCPTYPGFSKDDREDVLWSSSKASATEHPKVAITRSAKSEPGNNSLLLQGSPTRPNLTTPSRPPPVSKWKEQQSPMPAMVLPVLHPIAPDDAASKFETKYETPSKTTTVHETVMLNSISQPGSAFLPKYTPAAALCQLQTVESLVPLSNSPLPADQYEITDWEDIPEGAPCDEEVERKRLTKRIPAWCIGWVETAKAQMNIDPETVFGTHIPKCDLGVIFSSSVPVNSKKAPPKRGSSGEWSMDRITKSELDGYRSIMGHTQQLDSVLIVHRV